jgi:hypothetical protein
MMPFDYLNSGNIKQKMHRIKKKKTDSVTKINFFHITVTFLFRGPWSKKEIV